MNQFFSVWKPFKFRVTVHKEVLFYMEYNEAQITHVPISEGPDPIVLPRADRKIFRALYGRSRFPAGIYREIIITFPNAMELAGK